MKKNFSTFNADLMSAMKKALIIVFSNLKHDSRVNRQVNWVKKQFHTTVICFDAEESAGVTFIRIKQTPLTSFRKFLLAASLLLKRYSTAYGIFHNYDFLIRRLKADHFDLIIANDIDTLPLAFALKKNSKIIFDAHEYAPRHFENSVIWRTFFQNFYIDLCKRYISLTDAMLTVGKGLAAEYEKYFNIKPVVITNATNYREINPSAVNTNKIRLIHHGIINQSRRLELMIELMDDLDERFTLDLILMTSDYASPKTKAYISGFKQRVSLNRRITILPAVKSNEVVDTINQYDMGVFLIPPVNFNYANTLPNKLFDFIQARLGIAISPTPEMAAIVNEFDLGVVSEDFTPKSMALKLNQLTVDDIVKFKTHAGIAAKTFTAEKNEDVFTNVINYLFH